MKIATWNVNSIRVRLNQLLDWLSRNQPDVVCLQETKVVDADFPTEELQRIGYAVAMSGQKSYNGVAILTSRVLRDVSIGLYEPEEPSAAERVKFLNTEKRLIALTVKGLRIYSAYVPNGKSLEHADFRKKLDWLAAFKETVQRDIEAGKAKRGVVLCGDYNIAPDERDVYDVESMRGQLHFHPEEHAALRSLMDLGLVDTLRLHHSEGKLFSWWDYRMAAFQRNRGLRIDLVLLSQQLAEQCKSAQIDKSTRALPQPSDHAPMVIELED